MVRTLSTTLKKERHWIQGGYYTWLRSIRRCIIRRKLASFAGNWDKQDAQTGDRDIARSQHGYIILYYRCPLIWKSQLQTEIALSSTESEYTGLSYALHEAIPLMTLLEE